MNNELQQELFKRLDLLTEKIGQTGSELFASYVGTVQMEPWIYLTLTIFLIFLTSMSGLLCIWAANKAEMESELKGDVHFEITAVACGVLCFFSFVFVLICGGISIDKIPNLYYPEKAAFQELMKDLGQMK